LFFRSHSYHINQLQSTLSARTSLFAMASSTTREKRHYYSCIPKDYPVFPKFPTSSSVRLPLPCYRLNRKESQITTIITIYREQHCCHINSALIQFLSLPERQREVRHLCVESSLLQIKSQPSPSPVVVNTPEYSSQRLSIRIYTSGLAEPLAEPALALVSCARSSLRILGLISRLLVASIC